MTYAVGFPEDFTPASRGRVRQRISRETVSGTVALASSLLLGAWLLSLQAGGAVQPDTGSVVASAPAAAATPSAAPPNAVLAWGAPPAALSVAPSAPAMDVAMLDPAAMGLVPASLAESGPLGSNFPAAAVAPLPVAAVAETDEVLDLPAQPLSPLVENVPLPPVPPAAEDIPLPRPRPPEMRSLSPEPDRWSGRRIAQIRTRAVPAAAPDNRSFFEKVFGLPQQPESPVLAYAAPDEGLLRSVPRITSTPFYADDRQTAVYDIAAHTVFMPSGARLEAHSGLGNLLDDPRHVHERNRGATPPATYELTPRAQLFHGVQALRLTPVGGGSTFGRTGLLAHTFMLGPNGDSNGCVSFRDYRTFLQAYMNGEVRRLVVVASRNS